jgi:hypothetical protein
MWWWCDRQRRGKKAVTHLEKSRDDLGFEVQFHSNMFETEVL